MNVYNRMYLTDWSEGETEVFHNNRGAGSKAKEGMRIKGWYETAMLRTPNATSGAARSTRVYV